LRKVAVTVTLSPTANVALGAERVKDAVWVSHSDVELGEVRGIDVLVP